MTIEVPKASGDKLRLFVAYSRFEFALKEAGYLARDDNGIARADWPRFAREKCLTDVMHVASKNPDVREMIARPPQSPITDDGKSWRWKECIEKPITSLLPFFLAVKQVRNNLFHGGKSGEDPRDDLLCRAAWSVLELCLKRHHAVRSAFEYRY